MIDCNISGSNVDRLPKGWRMGAHWSHQPTGRSGYYLRDPDGRWYTLRERGVRAPRVLSIVQAIKRGEHQPDAD